MEGTQNARAELLYFKTSITLSTRLKLFELFFLKKIAEEDIIPKTNKRMNEGGSMWMYGKLLVWIELWFIIVEI